MSIPQHKADATAVFVHPNDPGWDRERIEREMAEMEKADPAEDPKLHPYVQHSTGYTRYDLDAQCTILGKVVTARDYLRADAIQWHLRRLTWIEWDEVQGEWSRANNQRETPHRAYASALRYALVRVEGPGAPTIEGVGRYVTHDGMEALHALAYSGEARFANLRFMLGQAAYTASIPLTPQEKKASGS